MSIKIDATFHLTRDEFNQLLPNMNTTSIIYTEKEEKLKVFLMGLYIHLYGKENTQSLWHCIISKDIIEESITFLQSTSSELVHHYFKSKINEKTFASIVEDDDFYHQLIDLILDDEEHIEDVSHIVNTYKNEDKNDESVQTDVFEQFLINLGIDEEGRIKAKAIKNDLTNGKPDMNKAMSFLKEYQSKFEASNVDFNTLYNMMLGEKQQLPFDLNGVMNMINTITSNMNQTKKRRR
jgi:hypothetical protein